MNLIDIYVSEIGRLLPAKNRADIQAEIKTAVEDLLDERTAASGKPADDELILTVLQAYGSPATVAATYQRERYLIGPKLYPVYLKIIQIVVPIIGVLSLVGLAISLLRQPEDAALFTTRQIEYLLTTFFTALAGFLGSMISALGWITLVFAILERVNPNISIKDEKWEARSLTKISPPDHISPTELLVEVFFSGLAILLFNFFPGVFSITPSLNGLIAGQGWQSVSSTPLLSAAFTTYVPYLTALWALTIFLNILLIQRGRWQTLSRWASIGLNALGIGIAKVMLFGPSLVALTASQLTAFGFPSYDSAQLIVDMINTGVHLSLIIVIVVAVIAMAKTLLILFRPRFSPQPVVK